MELSPKSPSRHSGQWSCPPPHLLGTERDPSLLLSPVLGAILLPPEATAGQDHTVQFHFQSQRSLHPQAASHLLPGVHSCSPRLPLRLDPAQGLEALGRQLLHHKGAQSVALSPLESLQKHLLPMQPSWSSISSPRIQGGCGVTLPEAGVRTPQQDLEQGWWEWSHQAGWQEDRNSDTQRAQRSSGLGPHQHLTRCNAFNPG